MELTVRYNWLVKHHRSRLALPASLFASSLLGLLLIMLFSDPVQNISYAVLFFAILLILLLSLGHLLVRLGPNKIGRRWRSRILIISVLLVIILMFRSAGSLNWVDILVLLLLGAGLLFYSSRRER